MIFLMKKYNRAIIDEIAKENGYKDKLELFYDYGITPSVAIIPQHKKWELPILFLKHINKNSKSKH